MNIKNTTKLDFEIVDHVMDHYYVNMPGLIDPFDAKLLIAGIASLGGVKISIWNTKKRIEFSAYSFEFDKIHDYLLNIIND